MENTASPGFLSSEQPVTMLEKVAFWMPYGGVAAAVHATELDIDFMVIGPGVPIGFVGGALAFILTRIAVNGDIDPSRLPEISDAENEANRINANFTAVSAGVAGIVGKYELTKFFGSGSIKELIVGTGVTIAAGFLASNSIKKYRRTSARDKLSEATEASAAVQQ